MRSTDRNRRCLAVELVVETVRSLRGEGVRGFAARAARWLRMRQRPPSRQRPKPPIRPARSPRWADRIAFPDAAGEPEVSIVIPVWNHWEHTLACLDAVRRHTSGGSYEVIAVDDASTDLTPGLLGRIRNLRVLRNDTNMGFLPAAARGAGAARGKHLFFLNNDAVVTPGWLPPLLAAAALPDVGAVGAKLVFPDGRLESAGAILWNDGSDGVVGRGEHPGRPEYNYLREVDYCFGAALLVRRDRFEQVGGFDSRYGRGYYEDTDLCLALRERGWRILYQPRSLVYHGEGVSAGDTAERHRAVNRPRLAGKWGGTALRRQPMHPAAYAARARDRRPGRSILVIDEAVPAYDRHAGSLRMFRLLGLLAELGHRVAFIGRSPAPRSPYTEELQAMGVEVFYPPWFRSVEKLLAREGRRFEIVILSRISVAAVYLDAVRAWCPGARLVFDTVDLHYLRTERQARLSDDPGLEAEARREKAAELAVARASDLTVVVSPDERDRLLREDPSLPVAVVGNIHRPCPPSRPFAQRKDVGFVGWFAHQPNVDAVLYFARAIWPLVREALPGVRFRVLGGGAPAAVRALHGRDGIELTGPVPDLAPWFEGLRLTVAPLRFGAGVKGKILESFAHGLPVVTTSVGAEGLRIRDGREAAIADDPAGFARAVVTLYRDGAPWSKCSANGLRCVAEHHSPEVARAALRSIFGSPS